jgi:hypothetical protein
VAREFGAKERPAGFEGRRAVVFLVEISMAETDGNLAILAQDFLADYAGVTDFFEVWGLDKISTGACGGAGCSKLETIPQGLGSV